MKVLTALLKLSFGTTPIYADSTMVLTALIKFKKGTTHIHAVSTRVLTSFRKFQEGTTHVLTGMVSGTNRMPPPPGTVCNKSTTRDQFFKT